jgi:hypothetical protein
MNINKQVELETIQSKKVGDYMTNKSYVSNGIQFSSNAGFNNNNFSGAHSSLIDTDSFLKNINIKNSKNIFISSCMKFWYRCEY